MPARRDFLAILATASALPLAGPVATAAEQAASAKKYATGVTDTKIKIGQTMPYSGANSVFSTLGRAEAAYFTMINDQGGINGRRIELISLDDGFSPPKTVEQIRR